MLAIKEEASKNKFFSVTEINTYSYCGAMYLYRNIWGLKEQLKGQSILNIYLGQICHKVLEKFLPMVVKEKLAKEKAGKLLLKTIDAALVEFKEKNPFQMPTLYQEIDRGCRRHLNVWFNNKLQFEEVLGENLLERLVEWSFGGEQSQVPALVLKSSKGDIKIKGQIDRIDISKDGEVRIFDYKLGKGPNLKDILTMDEIQLPIYMLAYQKLISKTAGNKVLGGGYYSLKKGTIQGFWQKESKEEVAVLKDNKGFLEKDEWDKYFVELETRVLDIVDLIEEGQFPRRSGLGKECYRLCTYRSICNTGN